MFQGLGWLFTDCLQNLQTHSQAHLKLRPTMNYFSMLIISQFCITIDNAPSLCDCLCRQYAFNEKKFNLCSRDLKAYMTFGNCTFLLVLLSDTAILRYASVVDSIFQLMTFFLVLVPSLHIPHGTAAREKLQS